MQSDSVFSQVKPAVPITEVSDAVSDRGNQKKRWTKIANPFRSKQEPPVPTERQPSPEDKAGFFSLLTFQWMASLMQVGYQRSLELNDIWDVNPYRSVPVLQANLLASFERRRESGDKKPLRNALYDTFRKEFLLGGFCSFVASLLQVISPFTLRYLIQFASDAYMASRGGPKAPPISHGIELVIGITLLQIGQTLCFNHFLYRGMIVGGQARAVLIALIFDKTTRLSGRARAGGVSVEKPPTSVQPGSKEEKEWMQENLNRIGATTRRPGWSNGRIMNLMSMDTSRVSSGSIMIHFLWTSPVSVCLSLALILVNMTYSALPGFTLLILVVPLLAKAVKAMIARRKAINTITDQRISLTQEMLHGVRFIKYFCWESAFLDRSGRNSKAGDQPYSGGACYQPSGYRSTFTLSNHTLKLSRVFSSLSLFSTLSMPLNQFPQILGQVTDAAQSILRIQDFLIAEEAEDPVNWDFENENAIVLENASFIWERNALRESDIDATKEAAEAEQKKVDKKIAKQAKDYGTRQSKVSAKSLSHSTLYEKATRGEGNEEQQQPFGLKDLNLTVGRHELIAVIGTVGSGKSSLLAALAGDMRKTGGSITLGASRVFCPQSAWIQNASVKENIIFGRDTTSKSEEVNDRWYNDVLNACALRPDLETFPYGTRLSSASKALMFRAVKSNDSI